MQHPDEGTIHSWLDGALSADEATRVEEHVKECSRCAAAVAEARGFIAGASRILTALDNPPRGVIPAATPRKRVDPLVWRVAATVLVVAAGTLVVVRNQRSNEQAMTGSADSSSMSEQRVSIPEQASAAIGPAPVEAEATTPKPMASNAPTSATAKTGVRESSSGIVARENKMLEKRDAVPAPQGAVASGYAEAVAPPVSTPAAAQVTRGLLALDAASESEPLKVVGTPRRIGVKVTLYEVAPGDTVTLTEPVAISLNSVVVTGGAAAPKARQTAGKAGKAAAAPAPARTDVARTTSMSDSSRATGAPPSAPPIVAPALRSQPGIANMLHTITWTDIATGNTLTLTGRMPEMRLQQIRIRIERERAAAAAAKKNP